MGKKKGSSQSPQGRGADLLTLFAVMIVEESDTDGLRLAPTRGLRVHNLLFTLITKTSRMYNVQSAISTFQPSPR